MFDTLKMKLWQKNQFIPDIKNAPMRAQFRGLPVLNNEKCAKCGACTKICPTGALSVNPLKIDLGKCMCPIEAKSRAKDYFDVVNGCKYCCNEIFFKKN